MLTRLFVFLLFFSITCISNSQVNVESLSQYISQARQDWNVPGMAVGIIKDGKVVLAGGFGTVEEQKNTPVNAETNFAIASNTKAFIATAICRLVEDGKIAWDDPVQKYLPYFQLYDPCVSEMTTIEDLLCHRVGLGTFSGDILWYKSAYTAEETVKRARHVPQKYPFRAGYGYSNLMFIAAGEVIHAVTGQSWALYIDQHLFKPLNMSRTISSVSGLSGKGNFATPHKPVHSKNLPIEWINWDNMGAAGGIISNVNDMLKWLDLQLSHGIAGKDTLFARSSQITMWTPHNNHAVSDQSKKLFSGRHFSGYGLGWGISDYGGRMLVSHGGGYDGMYSRVVLCPEEDLGIVILTNCMRGISTPLSYYILDRYFEMPEKDWSKIGKGWDLDNQRKRDELLEGRIKARRTGTKPSLPLESYAGEFHCPMYGEIEVNYSGEQLRLVFPDAPALNATLSHWHFNTFKINWDEEHAWFDWGTVQFILDNSGKVQELQFDVPNQDIFFEEIQARKMD